jgi:hypothetical protein
MFALVGQSLVKAWSKPRLVGMFGISISEPIVVSVRNYD